MKTSYYALFLLLMLMLLPSCTRTTSNLWKNQRYSEDVYGAHAMSLNGDTVIIVQGRRNQYMLEYDPQWQVLLEAEVDSTRVYNVSATRAKDRMEFTFTFRISRDEEPIEITGVAQILDNDTVEYEKPIRTRGIRVPVVVAPSRSEIAGRILATPLTVSADVVGTGLLTVIAPSIIGLIIFLNVSH